MPQLSHGVKVARELDGDGGVRWHIQMECARCPAILDDYVQIGDNVQAHVDTMLAMFEQHNAEEHGKPYEIIRGNA